MTNHREANQSSLLDEIEELQVLEAEELQEGVAFHAFRFHAATPMQRLVLTTNVAAAAVVEQLNLPQGAIVLDAVGDKLRIYFDNNQVDISTLEKNIAKSIGASVSNAELDDQNSYALTKV